MVGRTESRARADGFAYAPWSTTWRGRRRRPQADGYTGRAKFVVDEDRRVLARRHLRRSRSGRSAPLGHHRGVGEVPLDRLWQAVASFPTVSEIWLYLLEEYGL